MLLQYAKDVCEELGIEPPLSLVNNEDDDARRLLALFKSEGHRLMRRWDWEALIVEKLHTTTAGEDQGLLSAIAPDLDRMISDTTYNRSDDRARVGSVSPQLWQMDKARQTTRLLYYFRIRGGKLLMNPAPGAGEIVAFEYVSKNWVRGDEGVAKGTFTADSDTSALDEDILKLGVKWRFQKAIGGDWQADFQEYQEQLKLRFGADVPKGVLNMGDQPDDVGVAVVRINK